MKTKKIKKVDEDLKKKLETRISKNNDRVTKGSSSNFASNIRRIQANY